MHVNEEHNVVLSLRVAPGIKKSLVKLAKSTGRTSSYLAAEALEAYLKLQSWQIDSIEEAVRKADSKDARFADHEEVKTWLNRWGTSQKATSPECK
jgi:RHH-type rel operon transcriptional repressor/antitoxin RelB